MQQLENASKHTSELTKRVLFLLDLFVQSPSLILEVPLGSEEMKRFLSMLSNPILKPHDKKQPLKLKYKTIDYFKLFLNNSSKRYALVRRSYDKFLKSYSYYITLYDFDCLVKSFKGVIKVK